MQLILTEKLSVVKDISAALNPETKTQNGFILAHNVQMIITYVYQIADGIMPPTSAEEDFPFFPKKFQYEPIFSGSKQVRYFKSLLKGVHKVIIATDAVREGKFIKFLNLK